MISSIILFIAGLGLFFVGLQLLTENLKKLTDRNLRIKIANWTKNRFVGGIWGGIFMMITQSSSAATFIIVGMVRAGMMQAKQSLPIIIGLNIFGGIIIFLLILDIHLVVLFILGMSGMVMVGSSHDKISLIAGAVFGISILFLGIYHFQLAVEPLMQMKGFNEAASFLQGKFILSFLAGTAMTAIVQSSLPPVILMIPLAKINLIGLNEAIMFVYGANLGVSLLTYIFTAKFIGTSKQVAMFQVFYNIFCACILVPLFYVEHYLGVPLVRHMVMSLSAEIGLQIALVFMLFNMLPGVFLIFILNPIYTLLSKRWQESLEEQYSKPKYIYDQMSEDVGTAIDLVELEQKRLIILLDKMFDELRKPPEEQQTNEMFQSISALSTTIRETVHDITNKRGISQRDYERINMLLRIEHFIDEANETLNQLAQASQALYQFDYGQKFLTGVVEGIDAILLSVIDFIQHDKRDDFELVMSITSKDGNGITSVRKSYLSHAANLDPEEKMSLLSYANYSELLIWQFREIAKKYNAR